MKNKKFIAQRPTHSVPLVMGGTAGVVPNIIDPSDYTIQMNSRTQNKKMNTLTNQQKNILNILHKLLKQKQSSNVLPLIREVLNSNEYSEQTKDKLNVLRKIHLEDIRNELIKPNVVHATISTDTDWYHKYFTSSETVLIHPTC